MNANSIQEILWSITKRFFHDTDVIWDRQVNTRPQLPYVTIRLGDLRRNSHPASDENDDRYYFCRSVFEVNVYTEGKPMGDPEGQLINYENTAQTDLMDFCNFMESEDITDFFNDRGVTISFRPPLRDLTELEKERKYQYRAQAEFDIDFIIDASGRYGVGCSAERANYSGGDIAGLAIEIPEIENVEVKGD